MISMLDGGMWPHFALVLNLFTKNNGSFADYRVFSEGVGAREREGGSSAHVFVRPPLQKILPPKIFGYVFSEPHDTRSVRNCGESLGGASLRPRKNRQNRDPSDSCV